MSDSKPTKANDSVPEKAVKTATDNVVNEFVRVAQSTVGPSKSTPKK